MKKLIIGLMICMLILPMVMAFEFDNRKEIQETTGWRNYKDIKIGNVFGLGKTLWEGSLDYNTDVCTNCEATQTIKLHEKGSLIDEIIFIGGEVDYEIYYKADKDLKWIKYELGTELEVGIYQTKLIGRKNPTQAVDWIYKVQGETLDEWALWGGLFTNTFIYWDMDSIVLEDKNGTLTDIVSGIANFTNVTSPYPSLKDGIINDGTRGNSSGWKASNLPNIPDAWDLDNNFTWNFWINVTENTDNSRIFGGDIGGDNILIQSLVTGEIRMDWGGFVPAMDTDFVPTENEWYMITITGNPLNGSEKNVYINGVLNSTQTNPNYLNLTNIFEGNAGLVISSAGVSEFNGTLDEMGIWNVSLEASEISTLYNSGNGLGYGKVSSVVLNSPAINLAIASTEIEFNSSANTVSTTLVNVSLCTNVTGTWGCSDTVTLSPALQTSNTTTINESFPIDGKYLWNMEWCDADGDCGQGISNRTISIDTTTPIITINNPNGLTTNNGTILVNATIDELNPDTCWYNANGTNITFTCGDMDYFIPTNQYNITVWANDTLGNINEEYVEFNWNIKMNLRHNDGELITNPSMVIPFLGISTSENPYIRDSNNFLNDLTSLSALVNVTDTNGFSAFYSQNTSFNTTQSEYNITLEAKSLKLYFNHYNGTAVNVSGFWEDETEGTQNFTNTSIINVLRDWTQGIVSVMWAYDDSVLNYTQFYEYDNDWITDTTENMTVLEKSDIVQYIKVVDESNNPIDNVLVKSAYSKIEGDAEGWKEMGQRFTGDEVAQGMTLLYFDSGTMAQLRFTKDGYTAETRRIDMGVDVYTFTNPLTVRLNREDFITYQGAYITLPLYYNMNYSMLPMTIYAPSRSRITYSTNYRTLKSFGNGSDTLDSHSYACTNLTKGTDYGTDLLGDLIVSIWLDDIYWGDITIEYDADIDTTKFNEPLGLDDTTKTRFVWIGLILLVSILGMVTAGGSEEEGSGGMVKWYFMIGIIVVNLIFGIIFPMLLFIVSFWIGMLLLRKWTSE